MYEDIDFRFRSPEVEAYQGSSNGRVLRRGTFRRPYVNSSRKKGGGGLSTANVQEGFKTLESTKGFKTLQDMLSETSSTRTQLFKHISINIITIIIICYYYY